MNQEKRNFKLSKEEIEELFKKLKERLEKNSKVSFEWKELRKKVESNPRKMWSLNEMERTGGEPNLFEFSKKENEYVFYDFSKESPSGRRSVCYDQEALNSRKENKPKDSAINMANEMGIEILTEEEYIEMQKVGEFDTKTSSWVKTPAEIRKLGGAIFCDKRFERVFIYHNGAESYYAGRGFRGSLRI